MSDHDRGNPNHRPLPVGVPEAGATQDPAYEMLWNCPYCGAQKLLGYTHRHCPQCGAPQDPKARYYPSDDDKVLAQDHVYVGADRICPYCGASQSRNAKHCGSCGGALGDAKDAARLSDRVTQQYVPPQGPAIDPHRFAGPGLAAQAQELGGAGEGPPAAGGHPPPKGGAGSGRRKRILGVLGAALVVLGVVFAVLAFVWKRDAALAVSGHVWKREIDIEGYGWVQESRWCDEVPSGAQERSRHPEVRSHDKVKEGEDCTTRKVDNGDGTFREKRECKPRYVEKPVYADKCDYRAMQWHRVRSQVATGGLSEPPRWPEIRMDRPGSCDGCEREGPRRETYVVQFRSGANTHECSFDQRRWASIGDGSRWLGSIGRLTGTLDCGSLKAR